MLVEKLNVRKIMENVIKISDDKEIKKEAGKIIKMEQIEIYREIVAQACLKYGATHKKTVKLSQKLDELIVIEQRKVMCC